MMKQCSLKHVYRFIFTGLIAPALFGCAFFHNASGTIQAAASGKTVERDHVFEVKHQGKVMAKLNGRFYMASNWQDLPVVLFVPGSGNPSHLGTQKGNGLDTYTKPVNVSELWAEALAAEGFSSFTYDKRTCQPVHGSGCHENPIGDIYEEGPVALTKDVDAACSYLQQQLVIPNRNIILWTHGQGGQVVMASECGRNAALNVITSPITERVDRVLVRSLHHQSVVLRRQAEDAPEARVESLNARARNIANRAASFEATFLSLESDRFIEGAKFLGVPLSFWFGWRKLTEDIDLQMAKHQGQLIVLSGENDSSLAAEDIRNLRRFNKQRNIQVVFVPAADHHFVQKNKISSQTSHMVIQAIKDAWEESRL